jgi:DNA-binding HxlR family transcriptional regulator
MVKRRKSQVKHEEECPLSICMELIGGAWTPNILWHLKSNPRRFSELKDDIGRVSGKVLTQRLRRLVESGLVERNVVPTSPPTVEYSLTEFGHELRPAIEAIVRVGLKLQARA